MTAIEPSSARSGAGANPFPDAPPTIDRDEAMTMMMEARRLFGVAETVQARRIVGGIDSAVLAHRSLTVLMKLLVRLHGDQPASAFAELSKRARAIAAAESLLAEDLADDLATIDEFRLRLLEYETSASPADDRRYDRAFVRSQEWLGAVQAYLDQRLPPRRSRRLRRLLATLAMLSTFAFGIAIGRRTAGNGLVSSPTFINTTQMLLPAPPLEVPVTLGITNEHLTCEGCWPPEGGKDNRYAWTTGNINLIVRGLTPLRRYRIAMEIADAGHVSRVKFQESGGTAVDEVTFDQGIAIDPHPLTARIDGTLRWSLRMRPWRPKDIVGGSTDPRELGVAVRNVRIEEGTIEASRDGG